MNAQVIVLPNFTQHWICINPLQTSIQKTEIAPSRGTPLSMTPGRAAYFLIGFGQVPRGYQRPEIFRAIGEKRFFLSWLKEAWSPGRADIPKSYSGKGAGHRKAPSARKKLELIKN